MPVFVAFDGGCVLQNDAGEFTVYSGLFQQNGRQAGPGYVARWVDPAGTTLVDGLTASFVSANDPSISGISIPAWHHYRANGEADIWRRGWEVNPLRTSPCGVTASRVPDGPRVDRHGNVRLSVEADFADVYAPVMRVRWDYILEQRSLRAWVTFTQCWDGGGFPAFLKEPKLTIGLTALFERSEVYDADGRLLRAFDLTGVRDPGKHTVQLRDASRARVRLLPGDVNVAACGAESHRVAPGGRVARYGVRRAWCGSGRGLDGWAESANGRAEFERTNTRPYCLQGPGGTLSRNWEIAKRGAAPLSLMLHGWEDGTGLPDCLACARAFGPAGCSSARARPGRPTSACAGRRRASMVLPVLDEVVDDHVVVVRRVGLRHRADVPVAVEVGRVAVADPSPRRTVRAIAAARRPGCNLRDEREREGREDEQQRQAAHLSPPLLPTMRTDRTPAYRLAQGASG
jgi:hypothetical protein